MKTWQEFDKAALEHFNKAAEFRKLSMLCLEHSFHETAALWREEARRHEVIGNMYAETSLALRAQKNA